MKKIAPLIALVTSALVLAGCAVGVDNTGGGAAGALKDANTEITTPVNVPVSADLPDPHSYDGLTEVPDLGDVTPITDNPSPNLPVTFTDADGYEVTVTDTSRILALDLYGTYTKIIEGLGMRDSIVGRTVSSTEPAIAHVPVVTKDGHSINVEAVLQLKPTFIIVDHSVGPADAIDQIRAAGVPIAVLDPQRTLDSVDTDIRLVANSLGLEKEGLALAERSTQQLAVDTTAVQGMIPAEESKKMKGVFLYVRGTGGVFFIMGQGYGVEVLMDALGVENVAAGITGIKPANAEALAQLNPDVIFVMQQGLESTGGLEGLLQRPGVAQTTAGQKQRIISIPDGQSLSFGPMAGQQILSTAEALYAPDTLK